MPVDRIIELRALITAERVADGAHRQAPGPGKWAAWQCAEIDLRDAAAESLPALLDCAEMLDKLCTGLEWNIENHPEVMNQADEEALAEARAALVRLNGDDHD